MEDKTNDDKTISLGICMAGAVSAGAYTAGVIDYLLETLEAWEEAKKKKDLVPTHNVKIAALSGSSAGGIISVMLPKIMFIDGMPHVSLNNKGQSEDEKSKNLLYHTWINFFRKNHDIIDELLDPADIKEKKGFYSLLNSNFKKRIAKKILDDTPTNRTTKPQYMVNDLDVIVGVTNTSGYTYDVEFKNGNNNDAYTITTHRDLAHFVVTTDYDPETEAHKGKFEYNPTKSGDKQLQADAARGTSAFPVGFIAEHMRRDINILKENELLFNNKSGRMVHPEEIKDALKTPEKLFDNYNLDSGAVNNEPFEHLRTVMGKRFAKSPEAVENAIESLAMQSGNLELNVATVKHFTYALDEIINKDKNQIIYEALNKNKETFKNTILLIDPLPNTVQSNKLKVTRLDKLIPKILDLLQNQARFKPDMIEEAVDDTDFTKFIIAPRRDGKEKTYNGYKALASGFLGAFGGFMKKKYLEHDFYLGRKNCQSFLQHYFVVQLEGSAGNYIVPNNVLKGGYSSQEIIEKFKCTRDGNVYVPIIPDMNFVPHIGTFSKLSDEDQKRLKVEQTLDYGELPKIGEEELRIRKKQIIKRIKALLDVLGNAKSSSENTRDRPLLNKAEKYILGVYIYFFKVNGIARVAIDQIRKELRSHGLYKEDGI